MMEASDNDDDDSIGKRMAEAKRSVLEKRRSEAFEDSDDDDSDDDTNGDSTRRKEPTQKDEDGFTIPPVLTGPPTESRTVSIVNDGKEAPSEWSQEQFASLMRKHNAREQEAANKNAPLPSPMVPTTLFRGDTNSNVSKTSSLTTSTSSDRSHAGSVRMNDRVEKARAENALEKSAKESDRSNNNKNKRKRRTVEEVAAEKKPNKRRSRRQSKQKRTSANKRKKPRKQLKRLRLSDKRRIVVRLTFLYRTSRPTTLLALKSIK
jgi:hypothetical protein